MTNKHFSFVKQERIVSKKTIDELFSGSSSHSLAAFPIRAVYMLKADGQPTQVLMSVPKKHFKHAVDRNRVKRQMREAYRHHRQLLEDRLPEGQTAAIAFIWLADTHFPSAEVDKRIRNLLSRMAKHLSSNQ